MRNAAPIVALAPRRRSSRQRGRATHYLSGHRTRTTNPRGYQTTTSSTSTSAPIPTSKSERREEWKDIAYDHETDRKVYSLGDMGI